MEQLSADHQQTLIRDQVMTGIPPARLSHHRQGRVHPDRDQLRDDGRLQGQHGPHVAAFLSADPRGNHHGSGTADPGPDLEGGKEDGLG